LFVITVVVCTLYWSTVLGTLHCICLITDAFSGLAGAWVAGVADTSQWLEVNMNMPYKFTAIQIQGRSDEEQWVTSFKIEYYDGATWLTYQNSGGDTVTITEFFKMVGVTFYMHLH